MRASRLEGYNGRVLLTDDTLSPCLPLVAYDGAGYFELGEFVCELRCLCMVALRDGALEFPQEAVDVQGVGVA